MLLAESRSHLHEVRAIAGVDALPVLLLEQVDEESPEAWPVRIGWHGPRLEMRFERLGDLGVRVGTRVAGVDARDDQRPFAVPSFTNEIPQRRDLSAIAPEAVPMPGEGGDVPGIVGCAPASFEGVEVRFERDDAEAELWVEVFDDSGFRRERRAVAMALLSEQDDASVTDRVVERGQVADPAEGQRAHRPRHARGGVRVDHRWRDPTLRRGHRLAVRFRPWASCSAGRA